MITNMHIAPEWRQFALNKPGTRANPDGRYATVCGKRTTAKYIGIPGITGQPAVVNGKAGWCPSCALLVLRNITEEVPRLQKTLDVNSSSVYIVALLGLVGEDCAQSLEAV